MRSEYDQSVTHRVAKSTESSAMISKANAEHYLWGQQCDGWRLVTSDQLSVIHERMAPGTSEVRHFHTQSRQFFFILAGIAELEVNGKTYTLNVHEGIEIAPHAPHQMRNTSAQDV